MIANDLAIVDGNLKIVSFEGSIYMYVISYVLFFLALKMCAIFEPHKLLVLCYMLIGTLQLVMLNELLLLSNNRLFSVLLTMYIIYETCLSIIAYKKSTVE